MSPLNTVRMFLAYRLNIYSADSDEKCQKLFLEISENVDNILNHVKKYTNIAKLKPTQITDLGRVCS